MMNKKIITCLILFCIFIIGGLISYQIYQYSVHEEIEMNDVANIEFRCYVSGTGYILGQEQTEKTVQLFNGMSEIKRNPECSALGTPDDELIIHLKDGTYIIMEPLLRKWQVQISSRETWDSMYWGKQDELVELYENLKQLYCECEEEI